MIVGYQTERAAVEVLSEDQLQRIWGSRGSLRTLTETCVTSKTSHDTTTCLAADRWGNVVAATPSGWSGVQAGRTGVWLGSRLISFNTWPGHPNCIEPGKRPRITLTPTLVLKAGKPVLAVSVAGGDTQDQATLQMIRDLRHASARSFCRSDRNRRIPDRERHKPAPR